MARLPCNLFSVIVLNVLIDGSKRTFHWVYKPYGPKMCNGFHEDRNCSFRYEKENLSCYRIAANQSKSARNNPSKISSVNSKTDSWEMKNFSLPDNSLKETSYKDIKDGSMDGISKRRQEVTSQAPCRTLKHQSIDWACCHGNLCTVKYILDQGLADINMRNQKGRTPVMVAAMCGQKTVFDYLVSQNCNLTFVDKFNSNLLHLAIYGRNILILKELLATGKCDLEIKDISGQTPVMMAVIRNRTEVLHLLASKGCNLKVVDKQKNNLLHFACQLGHVDIAKYILTKNIIDLGSRNKERKTPLEIAKYLEYHEIVDLLLKNETEY